MIQTPVHSADFTAAPKVTLGSTAAEILRHELVIANLQCVSVQDAVIFSLTFQERLTYTRACDRNPVVQAFSMPYANTLPSPGTVAGMQCEITSTLTGMSVELTTPTVVSHAIAFTITASTAFSLTPAPNAVSNTLDIAMS